ncbi:anthranilate synthase component II [Coprinopsis cinerea okayama7|uniref:Anthranilate synthase component II n=1 Tax=Coprinopsis cinerea (strain Okayama-7 / 130 / ATCC MYA-4618 / FGSC 9003) TaxID=240176 RepID=A8NM76_COPC7|nr:anthranilate synthase component II [Coprinopsis cinerea okayama7\|eukprot:XP_001834858.2 anthranilate synthase component II [Coprinopsis cinerea okayama7\
MSESTQPAHDNEHSAPAASAGDSMHVEPAVPPSQNDGAKASSILAQIYEQRVKDVQAAKAIPGSSRADLKATIRFRQCSETTGPSLMAEIKRACPSKGDIDVNVNVALKATNYAKAGAAVISVVTEPTWFKGSLLDLRTVREAVSSRSHRPAILRRDFILDEYQIDEARVYGADAVLLIVAMLTPERLKALYHHSLSRGMEPLIEVNNAEEMKRALDLGAKVIGINNRNLQDFQLDTGTTTRLADMVQGKDVILCAMGGIQSSSDVALYAEHGVGAVMVGEALMRASKVVVTVTDLMGWKPKDPMPPTTSVLPWVKVTGIMTAMEARHMELCGADMLGFVFDPKDPRYVTSRSEENPAEYTSAMKRPQIVGVFKDQPLDYILRTVNELSLEFVQLNGDEPMSWSQHIPVPIIRRFCLHETKAWGIEEIMRPGVHAFGLITQNPRREVDWSRLEKSLSCGVYKGYHRPIGFIDYFAIDEAGNFRELQKHAPGYIYDLSFTGMFEAMPVEEKAGFLVLARHVQALKGMEREDKQEFEEEAVIGKGKGKARAMDEEDGAGREETSVLLVEAAEIDEAQGSSEVVGEVQKQGGVADERLDNGKVELTAEAGLEKERVPVDEGVEKMVEETVETTEEIVDADDDEDWVDEDDNVLAQTRVRRAPTSKPRHVCTCGGKPSAAATATTPGPAPALGSAARAPGDALAMMQQRLGAIKAMIAARQADDPLARLGIKQPVPDWVALVAWAASEDRVGSAG